MTMKRRSRNPVARKLRTSAEYRLRVVRSKVMYERKPKHPKRESR